MRIVYNGIFKEVAVPTVGDVVLKRGVPRDIADTPKSRGLLKSPDFSLADDVPEVAPEPQDPPADESEDTEDESAEDAENLHDEDVI